MLTQLQRDALGRATQALATTPDPGDAAEVALRAKRNVTALFLAAWCLIFLFMIASPGAPGLWLLGVLAIFAYGLYFVGGELRAMNAALEATTVRDAAVIVDRRLHVGYRGRARQSIVVENAHGERRELSTLSGADTAVVGDAGVVFTRGRYLWGFAPVTT